MVSLLYNAAVIKDNDAVCPAHRGEAVRDDQGRPVFHEALQSFLDEAFGFRIQGRGGFIQKKNRGVLENGSGNR